MNTIVEVVNSSIGIAVIFFLSLVLGLLSLAFIIASLFYCLIDIGYHIFSEPDSDDDNFIIEDEDNVDNVIELSSKRVRPMN